MSTTSAWVCFPREMGSRIWKFRNAVPKTGCGAASYHLRFITQQIFIDPGLTLIYSLKQFTDASNSAQKETVLTSLGSDGAYREWACDASSLLPQFHVRGGSHGCHLPPSPCVRKHTRANAPGDSQVSNKLLWQGFPHCLVPDSKLKVGRGTS